MDDSGHPKPPEPRGPQPSQAETWRGIARGWGLKEWQVTPFLQSIGKDG